MRSIGGVICTPEILDRIDIGDDDQFDDPNGLVLPPMMGSPEMDNWSVEDPSGDYRTVYDADLFSSTRRATVGAIVSLSKIRG